MDLEIIKRIFSICGKKSSCYLTSKFFYDFYLNHFDSYRLEMDFPEYKNITRNLNLKKKHNNPKNIHELLSIYHKYDTEKGIENIYLYLFCDPYRPTFKLAYDERINLVIKWKHIANFLDIDSMEDVESKSPKFPKGSDLINLMSEYHIKISNIGMICPTKGITEGMVQNILSIPCFKDIKKIDIISDTIDFIEYPLLHEKLEVFRFRGSVDLHLQYNLPNLKQLEISCPSTINISQTFPKSSKIETIKILNFSLKTPQPNLKKLTISYNSLTNSNFFNLRIKSLIVINDFPDFESYEDFAKLCKKSGLIIDDVENLTLLSVESTDLWKFVKYVNRRKIYQKIRLKDSFLAINEIFGFADFTFNLSYNGNRSFDNGIVHTFKNRHLLRKLKISCLPFRGAQCSVLEHISKLTNLESLRLISWSIFDGQKYYQRLSQLEFLKKIYIEHASISIEQATQILQLGNFCKIFGHIEIRYNISREIIDAFCLALTKNCIRGLLLEFYIDSFDTLILMKELLKNINESGMKFRYISCRVYHDERIKIADIKEAISINDRGPYGFIYAIHS